MKTKPGLPLRSLLCLLLCLALLPALVKAAPAKPGATIDLGSHLFESAPHVVDAFAVSPQVCALLYQSPDEGLLELIFFDLEGQKVQDSVPLQGAQALLSKSWQGGSLCLRLYPAGWEEGQPLLTACINPDQTVTFGTAPDAETLLPGGEVAILTAQDGSLVAKDIKTGREDLLIKGIPPSFFTPQGQADYASYQAYQPVADDVGFDGKDEFGFPLPFALPQDPQSYAENEMWLVRSFHFYQPLDAQRFVYAAYGWEWGAGFGMYDLNTNTDHRFTGRGTLFGLKGGVLTGTSLQADPDSLQTTPLPGVITAQLEAVTAMEDGVVTYDLSPDGRLLAIAGLDTREEGAPMLRISDLKTGQALYEAQASATGALAQRVVFLDGARVMVLLLPGEGGPASLQVFALTE